MIDQAPLPELPGDWEVVKIEDVVETVSTVNSKIKQDNYQATGAFPVIDQGEDFIGGYTDKELTVTCELPVVIFGDHTRVFKHVDFDFVAGADGVKVLKPAEQLNAKLFTYFGRALPLPDKGYARHFKYLKKAKMPLPPLSEQRRIVAKIEELFSNLEAGVAGLKRAQKQLQRYRQSVLQAAVEGRLTKDWRSNHLGGLEPADRLLERILEERQAQWENDYRAKYEAKGKDPPSGWKSRYKAPEEPDTSDLSELPEGWVWTNIEHVAISGPQNGLYLPKSKYGSGTPILRIDDYQNGWSRSADELQKVQADDQDIEKYSLHEGDIVINRVNSMTHLGKCLTVGDCNLPSLFESNMMRLHLSGIGHRKYFEYFLRSASGRQALLEKAKQAVNQASINQGDVKGAFVPLPPAEEQRQIVSKVDRLLSVADEATQTVEREIKRAERLRQSILKQAFSGKLVEQDEHADTREEAGPPVASMEGEQIEMPL